jgi:TetR/AcrR family transcriptional regulator
MGVPVLSRISAEDRRQQILDVAMSLFARQGFEGTTTRQIARVARVNEAIIFRHFPTKEDLYWAIIERRCQTGGRSRMIEERIRVGGSDREIFGSIAESMLTRSRTDQHITRLLLFTALERHELSSEFFRKNVAQQYERLAQYIRRRIDEGGFRQVDATLAARGFLGMVIYHYLIQELFGGRKEREYDPGEAGRELAEIWLRGMVVSTNPRMRDNHGPSKRNGKAVAAID